MSIILFFDLLCVGLGLINITLYAINNMHTIIKIPIIIIWTIYSLMWTVKTIEDLKA